MASSAGLPGVFPSGGMADQAQALQTFAQLQSLFMPNPAAAAQMMSMQQLQALAQLHKGSPLPPSLNQQPQHQPLSHPEKFPPVSSMSNHHHLHSFSAQQRLPPTSRPPPK